MGVVGVSAPERVLLALGGVLVSIGLACAAFGGYVLYKSARALFRGRYDEPVNVNAMLAGLVWFLAGAVASIAGALMAAKAIGG